MAIIEHKIAECFLDGRSAVFLRINDVTQRIVNIFVKGNSSRFVEIIIKERQTGLRHTRSIPKNAGDISFNVISLNLPWIPDDINPIIPGIGIIWHDPEKR